MTYIPRNTTTPEEDELQLRVAQEWLIAKKAGIPKVDSREGLEALGFLILKENELFYIVTPPKGFTKSTDDPWTSIFDATGKKVLLQCYRSADGDTYAFLLFEA